MCAVEQHHHLKLDCHFVLCLFYPLFHSQYLQLTDLILNLFKLIQIIMPKTVWGTLRKQPEEAK